MNNAYLPWGGGSYLLSSFGHPPSKEETQNMHWSKIPVEIFISSRWKIWQSIWFMNVRWSSSHTVRKSLISRPEIGKTSTCPIQWQQSSLTALTICFYVSLTKRYRNSDRLHKLENVLVISWPSCCLRLEKLQLVQFNHWQSSFTLTALIICCATLPFKI